MPVLSDIILLAYLDLGVISPGETVSPDLTVYAMTTLREMYASWLIEEELGVSKHYANGLTPGVSAYTFGAAGTLNPGETPVRVTAWRSYVGNIKNGGRPLSIEQFEEQSRDGLGTTSQIVGILGCDQGGPFNNASKVITIKVHPTPSALAGTLELDYYAYFDDIGTNAAATFVFPPGWELALRYNLAVAMASQFERITGISPALAANAQNSKLALVALGRSILHTGQVQAPAA